MVDVKYATVSSELKGKQFSYLLVCQQTTQCPVQLPALAQHAVYSGICICCQRLETHFSNTSLLIVMSFI